MEGISEYPLGNSLLLVRGEPAPLFVLNQAGQATGAGRRGLPARTIAATLSRTYGLPRPLRAPKCRMPSTPGAAPD